MFSKWLQFLCDELNFKGLIRENRMTIIEVVAFYINSMSVVDLTLKVIVILSTGMFEGKRGDGGPT